MVFWTVVLITYYTASLVRGNLFYEVLVKSSEINLEVANATDKKEKEVLAKKYLGVAWKMFLAIPLIIVEGIYLFNAIGVDIYKYPSIIMIFYLLFSAFVFNKTKKPAKAENIKRYTFRGIVTNLVFLGYFGYMFYILVLK